MGLGLGFCPWGDVSHRKPLPKHCTGQMCETSDPVPLELCSMGLTRHLTLWPCSILQAPPAQGPLAESAGGLNNHFVPSLILLLFTRQVVSDSLRPYEQQHTRLPLSFIISWGWPRLMSIESVMPSNHLILCRPILLKPLIFPRINVFSNELALRIRWPKLQLQH